MKNTGIWPGDDALLNPLWIISESKSKILNYPIQIRPREEKKRKSAKKKTEVIHMVYLYVDL